MYKFKYKIVFCVVTVFILMFNIIVSFATEAELGSNIVSENLNNIDNSSELHNYELEINDIYYNEKKPINITSVIMGNIYAKSKDFSITPLKEENFQTGGIVEGNLYLFSDNVNITSDYIKGEDGLISIRCASIIHGSVFAISDNFTLDPGCEIRGDLYVKASQVTLGQDSAISGNVYICSDNANVACQIGKDLYVDSSNLTMDYYCSISRDLHVFSSKASLSGLITRNSYLDCKNLTTTKDFLNQGNVTINSKNLEFSGEIQADAYINSKRIEFVTLQDNVDITCLISGNLTNSDDKEIPENVVLGKSTFEEYKNNSKTDYPFILKLMNSFSKILWLIIILSLIAIVAIVFFIIYLIRIILKK